MEVRTTTIEHRGRPMRLAAAGRRAGPELLFFVHGLGCAKESFRDAWARDELAGASLLAYDQPGFGDSERPSHPTFGHTLAEHAEVAAAVLEKELQGWATPPRIHLVAHSLGGAIALLLPDEILGSLASFVNLEGNLIGADCGWVSRRAISVPLEEFRERLFPAIRKEAEGMGEGRFSLDRAQPEAFYRVAESLVAFSDSEEPLRRFRALGGRKVYVYGDENREVETVGRVQPWCETVEIPAASHFLMNDNPAAFYGWLGGWIRALPPADRR